MIYSLLSCTRRRKNGLSVCERPQIRFPYLSCRVRFTMEQLTDAIHVMFIWMWSEAGCAGMHKPALKYQNILTLQPKTFAQRGYGIGKWRKWCSKCHRWVCVLCVFVRNFVVWEYHRGTTATMTTISWLYPNTANWILTYFPAWHFMLPASCPGTNVFGRFTVWLWSRFRRSRRSRTTIVLLLNDTEWFIDDDAVVLLFHVSHLYDSRPRSRLCRRCVRVCLSRES